MINLRKNLEIKFESCNLTGKGHNFPLTFTEMFGGK